MIMQCSYGCVKNFNEHFFTETIQLLSEINQTLHDNSLYGVQPVHISLSDRDPMSRSPQHQKDSLHLRMFPCVDGEHK